LNSLIGIRRLGSGDSHRNRMDFVVIDTIKAINTCEEGKV
jgi:hypothetical protein